MTTGTTSTEPSGKRPRLVRPDAPDRMWRAYFRGTRPMPILRNRLIEPILAGRYGWVEINGSPGAGKSILLEQVATALEAAGECGALVRASEETRTIEQILTASGLGPIARPGGSLDLDRISADIERRARTGTSGRFTLMIDDFDWCLIEDQTAGLRDLLARSPTLRLVTASMDVVPGFDIASTATTGLHRRVRWNDLSFTPEESAQLLDAHRSVSERLPSFSADDVLELTRSTAGLPLAIDIAVDRASSGDDPRDGFTIALALTAVRVEVQRRFAPEIGANAFSQLGWIFSFLPRFTISHVSGLFPGVPPQPSTS